MRSNVRPFTGRRYDRAHVDGQPRRFYPPRGQLLTLDHIRGLWRPSGTVAGAGLFAVVWSTRCGDFWAPLHDFEEAAQRRLVELCRANDPDAPSLPPRSPRA